MNGFRLYLASASPRRRTLLEEIDLDPIVVPQVVDERGRAHEAPRDLVRRLAEAKGRLAAARLGRPDKPAVILAADTTVVLEGRILGKPGGPSAAAEMLRRLRGNAHDVLTGVFMMRTDDGRFTVGVESTRVYFRDYDEPTLLAYVETGEPLDKAGAYGIQGLGAQLVDRIEGSWANVVGLPVGRLPKWLGQIGLELGQLTGKR